MNWEEACKILGVATDATPEEISKQYIYKAQLLHPDKTVGLPDNVRQKAEEELKKVNAAYNVLKDLKQSPESSPPKLKVDPTRIRFKNVSALEKKTTSIMVSSTGGPYTRFWVDDSPCEWLKVLEVKQLTAEPLPLEITLEAAGKPGLESNARCSLPIKLENEKTGAFDEVQVSIELQMAGQKKPSPFQVRNPFKRSKPTQVPTTPPLVALVLSLSIVAAFCLFGLALNILTQTLIPLPLLAISAIIFSIEKWYRRATTRFEFAGKIYKLFLNIAVLGLVSLIIWSGLAAFNGELTDSTVGDGLLLFVEIIALIFSWTILSNNNWRRPRLRSTVALAVVAMVIVAFAGVEPLASYKDKSIEVIVSLYTQIRNAIVSN